MKQYIFRKKTKSFLAGVLDAAGYPLARRFFKKAHSPYPPRHVLVIRMDHVGDVLRATAIPKAVKENFPECRLTFLTSSWGAPLLENNPFIDEVITYDAPWFSKNRYASRNRFSFFQLMRLLRKKGIDLAISLRGDLRENFLLAAAGIPERVGYGVTGGGFFLTREVFYRRGAHESGHALDLLRSIGIGVQALRPALYFSAEEEKGFPSLVRRLGLTDGEKYVGLQLGAGASAKAWPEENVTAFLLSFADRFPDHRIVFVGSGSPKVGRAVFDVCPRGISLLGKTTLRELCLLMRKFSIFIGPDSGPAHIAAAMSVPTLFLYSGTNVFEQWKSLEENTTTLRNPVSCSPCHEEICRVGGHPCMSGITPNEVLTALEKMVR
ncbi:MAG: glycosyltransferase family 9 protein [Candidatus Omnitrophica bacterium]|nr:glycosyltransferase family 9 protein [Candidatus Omnitrophota bacterium]